MSTTFDPVDRAGDRRYWPVPIIRAIPLLVVGFVVTFLADHSPFIGLVALAVAALGSGLAVIVLLQRIADAASRHLHLALGIVAVLVGAGSAVAAAVDAGFATLVLVTTVFALLTGALEFFAGLRTRRTAVGRDWLTVGIGTVVLGIALLIVPGDSIFVVGILGAYCAVVGVFLVIAGLSLKWARADEADDPTPTLNTSPEAAR